nr:hypothetical protein [Tanacetum cinerariifolium]
MLDLGCNVLHDLWDFASREDLEVLWRLFKDRFVKTKPMDYMDNFLLHTLKIMFEHHVKDNVWKNQQRLAKVVSWNLFDSCGVLCVTLQSIQIYLLVEKMDEEKRNNPPTKAQQRSLMCSYLKNMGGWKPKSLKNKSFDEIQELFDKSMKRIHNFVDFRTELVEEISKKDEAETAQESSSKRARTELEQENAKKQKMEDDKESAELKQCLEIVPYDGDNVTIDATLSVG